MHFLVCGLGGAEEKTRQPYINRLRSIRDRFHQSGTHFLQKETSQFVFLAWNEFEPLADSDPIITEQYPLISVDPSFRQSDVFSDAGFEAVLPPYSASRFDARTQEFVATTDYLGLGRIYYGSDGIAHAVGSKASLVATILSKSLDIEAVSIFAAMGWYGGKTTPWSGVQPLPPKSRVEMQSSASGRIEFRIHEAPTDIIPGQPPVSPSEVAESLRNAAKCIALRTEAALKIGLSGGRDSRLVSAALIAAGAPVEFNTIARFEDEVAIAKQVATALAPEVPHSISDPAAPSNISHDILQSACALTLLHDGMFEPAYIGTKMPAKALLKRLTVSGNAGELAHGHYYPKADVSKLASMESHEARKHLLKRLTWYQCGSRDAQTAVGDLVLAVEQEASSLGWSGVRLLDWFYLRERLRRWAGIAIPEDRVVSPLTSPAFVRGAFSQPLPSLVNSELHKRTIIELAPALSNIPFFNAGSITPNKVQAESIIQRCINYIRSMNSPTGMRYPRLQLMPSLRAKMMDHALVRAAMNLEALEKAIADCEDTGGIPRNQGIVKRAAAIVSLTETYSVGEHQAVL